MSRSRANSASGKSARAKPAAKPAAKRQQVVGARLRHAGNLLALMLIGAHAALLLWLHQVGLMPIWLLVLLVTLTLTTVAIYAYDKRAAVASEQRIPENRLHLLELLGGWPGALLAQRWLRHKNRKLSYQAAFWACVLAHEALLIALLRTRL